MVAADVYAIAPHTGRGGWTWYTGSASWLYQLMVESLLGVKREANHLRITPCIPPEWNTYTLHYRFGETLYRIVVTQTAIGGNAIVPGTRLDGEVVGERGIALLDDRRTHLVEVDINRARLPVTD